MAMTTPFRLPMAWTSWEFLPGVDSNAAYNTAKAGGNQGMGGKSVAVEYNQGVTKDQVAELKTKYGFQVLLWGEADSGFVEAANSLGVDGIIPQIEGYAQFDTALFALQHYTAGVKAIVSGASYSGLDSKAKCDLLRAAGAAYLFVEAYADEGASHADLKHFVIDLAAPYGWDAAHVIPVCGTYRGELPSAYTGLQLFGRNFGCYVIEPMPQTQLDAWRAVPDVVQAPPVTSVTDADTKQKIIDAATAWEKTRDPATYQASRIHLAKRIAQSGIEFSEVRDAIKTLLDDVGTVN